MSVPPLADLHTHILPDVDDGAPDLEASVRTLEALEADGVAAVCATPHLRASATDGDRRARADAAWAELGEAVAGRLAGLALHRGYEILLDSLEWNFSDPGLRIAGTRYALVEWVAFTVPPNSAEILERLAKEGLRPIVAHAERYFGYLGRYDVVGEWRRRGALIQVNSGSLWGAHGEGAEKQARALLERGWVDLLASDTHARPGRSPSVRAAYDALAGAGASETAELLLSVNPRRILEDEPTLPVSPPGRRGIGARLAAKVRRLRRRNDPGETT